MSCGCSSVGSFPLSLSLSVSISPRTRTTFCLNRPPIRTLTNLGSGVVDLVVLPMLQYQKDGRALLGLQRGVSSFVRSFVLETLSVASRVSSGAERVLNTVGEAIIPESITRHHSSRQPVNVLEGISQGMDSVSDGVFNAVRCVIAVPVSEYEDVGSSGAVRSVIRAVPVAFISPVVGAARGLSKVLLGVRNSLDDDGSLRRDEEAKFKNAV